MKVGKFVSEEVATVKIKSLTMALTVVSGVSVIISLVVAKELISAFTSTFTFFSANALAFYSTKEGRTHYMKIIKMCYITLIVDFCLLIISDVFKPIDGFCLWGERIGFIPVAALVIIATIRINANTEINFKKKIVD
jgi:hypothetical protein